MLVTVGDFRYVIIGKTASVKAYIGGDREIEIPDRVQIIGNIYPITAIEPDAFYEDKQIQKVILPGTMESIGDFAFCKCLALEEVVMQEGIKTIGMHAMSNCPKLKRAVFPQSVTVIEKYALKNDPSLEEVFFPSQITVLQEGICEGARKLTEIVLPECLETIENSAFYNCGLSEVIFSEGVRRIEYLAFNKCPSFLYAWLPNGITYCSAIAFEAPTMVNVIAETVTEKTVKKKGIACQEYLVMNGKKKIGLSLLEKEEGTRKLFSVPPLPSGEWEAISGESEILAENRGGTLQAEKEGLIPVKIVKRGHPAFGVMAYVTVERKR